MSETPPNQPPKQPPQDQGSIGKTLLIAAASAGIGAIGIWFLNRTLLKDDSRKIAELEKELARIQGAQGQMALAPAPNPAEVNAAAFDERARALRALQGLDGPYYPGL